MGFIGTSRTVTVLLQIQVTSNHEATKKIIWTLALNPLQAIFLRHNVKHLFPLKLKKIRKNGRGRIPFGGVTQQIPAVLLIKSLTQVLSWRLSDFFFEHPFCKTLGNSASDH